MPWVIGFNVLVLGPLLLWTLYELAGRIAGRAFGLLAATVWVVLPYAVIPLWRGDYHERYIEQFLPGALGLTGLADYQSMVLLLVGSVLFLRALQLRTPLEAVAAGLVVGFAIGMKPSNGLFVAAPIVAALVARNLRPLLPFALAIVPALLTLAVWKQRGFGSLPAFAAEETRLALGVVAGVPVVDRYVDLDWGHLHENFDNLREYFWSARLLQWAPIAGTFAVARRSPVLGALLATWFGVFLVVKGTTVLSTVSSGSFFRFLMPAFPAYFLLGVSLLLLVPTLGRRLAARWPATAPRPVGRRLVIVLGVCLAARPARRGLARPPDRHAGEGHRRRHDRHARGRAHRRVGEGRRRGANRHLVASAGRIERRLLSRLPHRTERPRAEVPRPRRSCGVLARDGPARDHARAPLARRITRPPGVRYRIGVAANSRNDITGGDVATLSPPVESP